MKYQLVVQFEAVSLEDFDRLVELEEDLIRGLDGFATVDGHDFGLGIFNVFILTDDPAKSFDKAHRIVTSERVPNVMRSAYREVDGEDYVILCLRRSRNLAFCNSKSSMMSVTAGM